jgi:hypothetical protein
VLDRDSADWPPNLGSPPRSAREGSTVRGLGSSRLVWAGRPVELSTRAGRTSPLSRRRRGSHEQGPFTKDAWSAVHMLRLDWNMLQPGDRVLVHDADDPQRRLVAGVVSAVLQTSGPNEVTIRVTSPGHRVIQPMRLSVHHDPVDFDGQCWRCAGPLPASQAPARPRPRVA